MSATKPAALLSKVRLRRSLSIGAVLRFTS